MKCGFKRCVCSLVMSICMMLSCVAVPVFATVIESENAIVSELSVASSSYTDALGLKDNTQYYIMNFYTQRLLSLETALDSDGIKVITRTRSSSNLSKWKTQKTGNQQYQLVSVYSPTSKVLNVSNSDVEIYTDNNSASQKFTISRIASGTYQGLYTIKYGSYYVAQDSSNDIYLTSSFGNTVAWSFMAVDKGYADLSAHDYYYYR